MPAKPSPVDSECDSVEEIHEHLLKLDNSRGKVWDFSRSQAAIVLCVASTNHQAPLVFVDCILCSSVVASPAWEPTKLRIEHDTESTSDLILTDSNVLRIACKSIRLDVESRSNLWFCGPTSLHTYFDLLARIRQTWEPKASKSFAALCLYLDGYSDALSDNSQEWSQSELSLVTFQDWLKAKFGYSNSSGGWRHIIAKEFPDDEKAYEQFYRLLDEFCRDYRLPPNQT